MFNFVKSYFRANKTKIIQLSLLTLIVWVIGIIMPYLQGSYLDGLLKFKNIDFIIKFTLIILIVSVSNIIFSYLNNMTMLKLNTKISFQLNNNILNHIKKVNIVRVQKFDSAYLTQRVNNDANCLISFFLNNYLNIFIRAFTLIFSMYMLFSINLNLIFGVIIFIPIYTLIYILLKKPLFKKNMEYKEQLSDFFGKMNEQLTNMKNIKVDSSFMHYENKLLTCFNSFFKSVLNLNRINYVFYGLNSIVSSIAYVLIFFYGGLCIINDRISIGQFTMITSYFGMIMSVVDYYLNIGRTYQDAKSSYKRISEIYSMPIELNGKNNIIDISSITLENVSFSYDKGNCIEDFSYTFTKGNIYCVIGKNGAGKSTLINLLLGILNEGYSGDIYYNNEQISNLDMYEVRKKLIGVTQQEPLLEADTIENIFKIYSGVNDSQVINQWISKFYIKDFIDQLPQGLNSKIDSYSRNLSGGEKQKISLIRTFLKNPELIILDEPTSALDVKSIEVLKRELVNMKENKIIIVITHNESLLDLSDFVIDLNSHNQLKNKIV